MPPWGANPAHGTFKNDPRLSEQGDRDDCRVGGRRRREGRRQDLSAQPQFADGWTIGKPDAVFTMDEELQFRQAARSVPYFRVPTHLTEDKWIQAIEIKPGARSHVHHVIAFTQKAGEPLNPGAVLGPTYIGGVTPNKPGLVFEPGVARMLRGNSDIVMQMHYTTNGTEVKDRTEVGIIYAKQPPTRLAAGGLVLNPRFVIPANDGNAEVKATSMIARDTVVTTLTPHMHMRGKDMIYIAHYPDGTSETLLSVPKYNFNWQITYAAGDAEDPAEGHAARGDRALRQLDGQQVQSRSVEGRPVGRSDVGRDDDRLLLDRDRSARRFDGAAGATAATLDRFRIDVARVFQASG